MGNKLCVLCGKPLPKTAPGNRKYCDNCQDAVADGRKYDNRSLKMERKREEMESAQKIPPKPETKSLGQMAREARELGLTYGQYSALLASGGLEQYLKNHEPKKIARARIMPTKWWN